MLIVLSPAKSLDYTTPPTTAIHSMPAFLPRAKELVAIMRKYSPADLSELMEISDPLAQLNAERFHSWTPRFTPKNAKQAALAFDGDVYDGLRAPTMTAKQLEYTQQHIRILSGLYGLLRPLDLMQAYRLEMGSKVANPQGKDLYAFWGDSVTEALNRELAAVKTPVLVNLASEEYFRVVRPKLLQARVVTPVFEEWKNGQYKIISFFAKRARGMLARYAAVKKITAVEKLKKFDVDGYAFAPDASDDRVWRFRRNVQA